MKMLLFFFMATEREEHKSNKRVDFRAFLCPGGNLFIYVPSEGHFMSYLLSDMTSHPTQLFLDQLHNAFVSLHSHEDVNSYQPSLMPSNCQLIPFPPYSPSRALVKKRKISTLLNHWPWRHGLVASIF